MCSPSVTERVAGGKAVPMPDYRYQEFSGKSGSASSDKPSKRLRKIKALQNFVPAT